MRVTIPALPDLLRSKPTSFLGWSGISDPMLVGLMARAGYDVLLFDQQHGFHDTSSCAACLTEAALAGRPGLVRIKVGDFAEAAKVMDLGAAGVVAPMINGSDDARAFASYVKYAPIGQRSWGPGRAMQLAGLEDGQEYFADANGASLAIAMCETREAFAALDDILAVPGIDGILVGPSDLSIALSGGRLDPSSTEVRAALREIARRTRNAGKFACAFAGSVERARETACDGYQLVSVGYDEKLIGDAFVEAVRAASS